MKRHVMLAFIFVCILIGWKVWVGLSILDWINMTFLLGIVALALTVTMNIWKTGFLSLFVEGFKVLGNWIVPKTRSAVRTDYLIKNDDRLNQWKENIAAWTSFTFTNLAVISLTISIISLIVYYQ
ncbi:DUF3899 domain-containing protein [Heyndrickxia sp. NPDC080065]|uniref:DUF3899 domain-containing protein n=1 Tax=Heyndrickxia sp. NPDC080065 TaxID=3390568 RepID=UPI003CFE0A92